MKYRGLKILSPSKGFTIIELIVVITILGILMGIGTVTLNGSMSRARDNERKSDAEAIALHLENFYKYGSDNVVGANYPIAAGEYPDVGTYGLSNSNAQKVLRDIDTNSLAAPGKDISSFKPANTTLIPNMNENDYYYQPFAINDTGAEVICDRPDLECRRFKLYYKLENANSECPGNICTIESKNQ